MAQTRTIVALVVAVCALVVPAAAQAACSHMNKTLNASGSWDDPSKWTPAGVPTATSNVCIPAGRVATKMTGAGVAQSLWVDGELAVNPISGSASVTVTGGAGAPAPGTNGGKLAISASGSLIVNTANPMTLTGGSVTGGGTLGGSATFVFAGSLSWAGPLLANGGPMTITGTLSFDGGTVDREQTGFGDGTVVVQDGGVALADQGLLYPDFLTLSGPVSKPDAARGRLLVNVQTNVTTSADVDAGAAFDGGLDVKAGILTIHDNIIGQISDAELLITPATAGVTLAGGAHSFQNVIEGRGTFKVLSGASVGFTSPNVPYGFLGTFDNAGDLDLGPRTENLVKTLVTHPGSVTSGSGEVDVVTLEAGGGTISEKIVNHLPGSVPDADEVPPTLVVSANTTFDAPLEVNGTGTINPGATMDLTPKGAVTVKHAFSVTGTAITGSGTLNLTATGTLTGSGSIAATTTIAGTVQPAGTLAFTGNVQAQATALFEMAYPANGADDRITVSGTATLAGTLALTIDASRPADIRERLVVVSCATACGGQFATVTGLGNRRLRHSAKEVAVGIWKASVATASAVEGGTLQVPITLTEGSTDLPIPFTVTVTSGTATSEDFVAPANPVTLPAGATTVDIPITLIQDNLVEPTEQFHVKITAPAHVEVVVGEVDVTITDDGDSIATGGCLPTDKRFLPASGSWASAANWLPAAVPTATDIVCIPPGRTAQASGLVAEIHTLRASGILTLSNSALDVTGGASRVHGTVTISGSTLVVRQAADLTVAGGGSVGIGATATLDNRTTLTLTGGITGAGLITNSGRLQGTGTATAAVDNSGVIAPGAADGTPGTLTIGSLIGSSGTLRAELAEATADRLEITGGGKLGGTLDVDFLGDYVLGVREGRDLVTCSPCSAGFASISGDTVAPGRRPTARVNAQSARLGRWLLAGAPAAVGMTEGSTADVVLTLAEGPLDEPVTVPGTGTPGTAQATDYAVAAAVVTAGTGAITATATQDADQESDEQFTVTVTPPAYVQMDDRTTAVTIADDDTPPTGCANADPFAFVPATGSFEDGASWAGGAAPGAGDVACIPTGRTATLSGGAARSVAGLRVDGGLILSGAGTELSVAGSQPGRVSGFLAIKPGARLDVAPGSALALEDPLPGGGGGTLRNRGTLSGAGSLQAVLENAGRFAPSGLNVLGDVVLSPGGTFAPAVGATLPLDVTGAVTAAGTFDAAAGALGARELTDVVHCTACSGAFASNAGDLGARVRGTRIQASRWRAAAEDVTVVEGQTAQVTIALVGGATDEPLQFGLAGAASGVATIAAGQTSTTFQVPTTGDAVDGPDQTLTVDVTPPGHVLMTDRSVAVEVADDEKPAATPTPGPTATPTPETPLPLLLGCDGGEPRTVVLVDVFRTGKRVSAIGVAAPRLAGQTVAIAGKGISGGTARVRPDGSFSATFKAPPAAARRKASYTASIRGASSAAVKLQRKLVVTGTRVSGGTLRVSGRAAGRRATVTVTRLVTCSRQTAFKKVRTNAAGRFTVALPLEPLAFYRARVKLGGRTHTLPILVRR
jgi:hypothetical protein